MTNSGTQDAFIVKYNTDGTPQWARRIGGSSNDVGLDISADSTGNIYVTGRFSGTSSVFAADGTTSSFSLTTSGFDDAFIVKYNTDGTPQWARRIGGTGTDIGESISTDSSGNVYVTGNFSGTASVFAADGTTATFTSTTSGGTDVFIVKYNTDGTPQWVRKIGATGNDEGYGISTDSSGNVYVTGTFRGTISVFASDGTTATFTSTSSGSTDAFVVKYNTDGTPQWARKIGGTDNDNGVDISTDSSGNVYVTGYYFSTQLVFFPVE